MDKVKVFLVKYCEWLALGLASAFLLWMLYTNVLEKPVTVPVGSEAEVVPGDVYAQVWSGKQNDGPGTRLEAAVSKGNPLPGFPTTPDFGDRVKVAFDPHPAPPLSGYSPQPAPTVIADAPETVVKDPSKFVTALPIIPPPTDLAFAAGHSNVTVTPPNGTPAGGGTGTVSAVDKNWVTVKGVLSAAALAKSFSDANVPPIFPTQLLRVDLIRQELDPSGSWGPDTTIGPLSIYPTDPLPPVDAALADQAAAEDYAAKNAPMLFQPAFYPVVNGDKWYLPGTMNPNVEDTSTVEEVKPTKPTKPVTKVTPVVPPVNRATGGGTSGTNGGKSGGKAGGKGGQHSVATSDQNSYYYGGGGGGGPPPSFGDKPAHREVPPPSPGDPVQDPTPDPAMTPGAVGTTAAPPLPSTPKFNPAQISDITVWAHDDTVEPGKTYRYAMKYYVLNPVAGTTNLCKPQSLADVFRLESGMSDWTTQVRVDSDTNFFAKDTSSRDGIKFDIFKWKNGVWQMETVEVHAGDVIGSVDPRNKTDFTTGWTLVDVRQAANDDKIILLANDNGTVVRKELRTDKNMARYHKLLELVNKANPNGGNTPPPVATAAGR